MIGLEKWGNRLVVISAYLFAIAIPVSIALDNVAAGIGILGFIFLLISKAYKSLPPLKPLLFFLIPELIRYLFAYPLKILKKTDFNHHLISYFVSFKAALNRNVLRKLIIVLLVSTLALCFSVIFEAFTWQNIKHINWNFLSLHTTVIRGKGFFNHPLTTGGVLFLLFMLFFAFYFKERRWYYLFTGIVLIFSILLNESRSYWLSLFFFLIILLILSFRDNKKLVLISLAWLVLIGGTIYRVPVLKERLKSVTNTKTNDSNMDRLALWKSHLKAFREDYSVFEKFFGSGDNASRLAWKHFKESFCQIYKKYCKEKVPETILKRHFHGGETHNVYLKFLTKYGIVGLFGYLLFWGYVLYYNFSCLKKFENAAYIKTFIAGYLGFLIAGLFENNFTDAEVQFALMFILGLNFALLDQIKSKVESR